MRLNLTDDKTNTQMSLIETRWSRPTKLHFLESADAISSSSATLLLPAVTAGRFWLLALRSSAAVAVMEVQWHQLFLKVFTLNNNTEGK